MQSEGEINRTPTSMENTRNEDVYVLYKSVMHDIRFWIIVVLFAGLVVNLLRNYTSSSKPV